MKDRLSAPVFFEFFAGGGMAGLGLGENWRCAFANDIDPQKAAAFQENFPHTPFKLCDIGALTSNNLPQIKPDLAWASFPCQDLSLAGARNGLHGTSSGAFFAFWRLMTEHRGRGCAPRCVIIENVTGLLSSAGGRDFSTLISLIAEAGYAPSALVLDAKSFSPQSRPRIFIFAFDAALAHAVTRLEEPPDHDAAAPRALQSAVSALPKQARDKWVWLAARPPETTGETLETIIDQSAPWAQREATRALVAAMGSKQRARLRAMEEGATFSFGAGYRRIRIENGCKVQRFEARFDGLAGCLRTPAGGSSRQFLVRAGSGRIDTRLMTPREAARLMGLPEAYALPKSKTAALKLCGDGVSAPVVSWIARAILEPAMSANLQRDAA